MVKLDCFVYALTVIIHNGVIGEGRFHHHTGDSWNVHCQDQSGSHVIDPFCVEQSLPGSNSNAFEVRNIREYYIQAEKIVWDYLPYGQNLINYDMGGRNGEVYLYKVSLVSYVSGDLSIFTGQTLQTQLCFSSVDTSQQHYKDTLVNGPNRIGSRYSKYVYKEYTDKTFTQEIPKPQSQGFVGPTLRGEVGEIIRVYFRNKVDIPVSVHPHGVLYDKNNEGALYADGTDKINKTEDAVKPGSDVTLTWKVTADFAPGEADPPCIPFAYHSHVNPDKEVNAGLLGLVLVCKQGALNSAGVRSDVDKEIVLYVDSLNEGESWLIDENLNRCQDPAECIRLFNNGDADFDESLAKDSINGYMFGNMPGLNVCAGQKLAVYVFSLNAEPHPINIFGHTFETQHHRSSVVGIWSATFRELELTPVNPGRWMVQCLNSEHNRNGMRVYMSVSDCHNFTKNEPLSGTVRRYFFSAETQEWDYAPSGRNLFDDMQLTEPGSKSEKYFSKTYNGQKMIGKKYTKSRFVQYKDITYSAKVAIPATEQHLGMLGPVIRAEVGDTIQIALANLTPHPVSIYLQGTSFDESQNGMWLKKPFAGTYVSMVGHVVKPILIGQYTFTIPWSLSPAEADPPCVTHMYYSTANMERDVSSGLVGPLVICKAGQLDRQTGLQKYVDREMFLFFSSIDENFSWYIDGTIATYINDTVDKTNEDFVESNVMRSVNGRSYGNLEGLNVCKGKQVVWHVMSFGNSEGIHGVTFNGNNILVDGINRDSHVTISGLSFSAAMHPDNVGNWSVSCHNDYHFDAGMKALYHVDACGDSGDYYYGSSGVVRRYYIAAVERKWNYSPRTIHPLTEENYTDPSSEQFNRVQKDGIYVGSVYTKALYREFTDSTFTTEKPETTETMHLGVLGPFIRAQVGDTIEVVFKNMATRNYSIHAQGLRYNKSNEGSVYVDGISPKPGSSVQPGATYTYRWEVTESNGPAQNGPNCVNFMYHSAVNQVKDTYAGLAGPIVICKRGILDSNGKRTDSVEREFALLFQAFDENESWYIGQNIQENCPSADTTTDDFIESNKYDSINALIYNNVRGLTSHKGDNIAWYIMGLGENEDIHTVHFHGQTYTYRTGRTHTADVVEVFPGTYETVEMFATNPGTWLIHCHVGQHTRDGMIATYTVLDSNVKR